jgi:ribonuclease BN (tRNA processing enzyme)
MGPAFAGVMLGSGGWMSTSRRATSCLLFTSRDGALMLDAGTGVAALAQQSDLLGEAGALAIALTHFHLDHVAGLTYLPAIADRVEITVWAPGQLLGDAESRLILEFLIGAPYLSVGISDFADVRELAAGENRLGPFTVEARVQRFHPGGSVAFRVGDALAYCTDTAPDPDSASFVRGVTALVHEAWTTEKATFEHSSAVSAAQTAADAGVNRLVLSHIHPLADDPAALLDAARPVFAATEVGYDGMEIR